MRFRDVVEGVATEVFDAVRPGTYADLSLTLAIEHIRQQLDALPALVHHADPAHQDEGRRCLARIARAAKLIDDRYYRG